MSKYYCKLKSKKSSYAYSNPLGSKSKHSNDRNLSSLIGLIFYYFNYFSFSQQDNFIINLSGEIFEIIFGDWIICLGELVKVNGFNYGEFE